MKWDSGADELEYYDMGWEEIEERDGMRCDCVGWHRILWNGLG